MFTSTKIHTFLWRYLRRHWHSYCVCLSVCASQSKQLNSSGWWWQSREESRCGRTGASLHRQTAQQVRTHLLTTIQWIKRDALFQWTKTWCIDVHPSKDETCGTMTFMPQKRLQAGVCHTKCYVVTIIRLLLLLLGLLFLLDFDRHLCRELTRVSLWSNLAGIKSIVWC